jgi:V/A-type H+-transporting ATPase subunit I
MAILPMKRIHIYALLKDRKQILKRLQQLGSVQLDNLQEDEFFIKIDTTADLPKTEREMAMVNEALSILDSHVPENQSILSSLNGRQELTYEAYEELAEKQNEFHRTTERIISLNRHIAECISETHRLQVQIDALAPWSKLDIPLQFQGTRLSSVFIGTLSGEVSLEQLLTEITNLIPEVEAIHADIINKSKEQTCIFVVCHRKDANAVDGALRAMGFARPSASSSSLPPAKQKSKLEGELKVLVQEVQKAKAEIAYYADQRENLKFLYDWLAMKYERQETAGQLLESKRVLYLTGYIPEREVERVASDLKSKFILHMDIEDPDPKEDVPILLENNKFVEPVEGVLASFSYPGKGEIDPSAIMSIFYYILFGLMLSDAAYGLIMAIGCGLCLWKFPNMEKNMRKTLRMFFFCGLSTTFWGSLFGSWFGDVVTVVSTTFFNKPVSIDPLWFEPMKDPMRMLVFSMAMGIVHLFAGLAANIVQNVKAKQYKDAFYDAVLWYMLVGGLIVFALSSQKFVEILSLSFIVPASIGKIASIVAAAAAVGIVLTAGRESRNWFKRIAKGLYELYNISGYMSDILSYSRLLALGLATGVIATVINQMGAMGGSGIGGAILFIIVFLVGHSINIGINLLGAYVHTNRLSFVEFFGKFYEGGGSEFTPLGVHTKYYKLKEETNHG